MVAPLEEFSREQLERLFAFGGTEMVRNSFTNHFVLRLPGIHLHLADRVPENLEPLSWRRLISGESTLKIDVHFHSFLEDAIFAL